MRNGRCHFHRAKWKQPQATGAHPDEGMTPAQLETFFERTTNSSGQFTKGSLERIVVFVDEDGDGLVRNELHGTDR